MYLIMGRSMGPERFHVVFILHVFQLSARKSCTAKAMALPISCLFYTIQIK